MPDNPLNCNIKSRNISLTAVGKIFNSSLKQDTMKRTTRNARVGFRLKLNISVDPDKTYGTVLTIEIEPSMPQGVVEDIQSIMAHYAFHIKIIKNHTFRD